MDAGEDLGIINIASGTWVPGTVYPQTLIVPSTGAFGATRMRIVCMGNASGAAIQWVHVNLLQDLILRGLVQQKITQLF